MTAINTARGLGRDFNIFWLVQTLSTLGNSFALLALPLLVLQATGSVAQMGLVTGVAGGGSVLSGLFAGLLVDRLDRRKIMMVCDAARIVLFGLIPLWWLIGPQVWLLYVVMLLASIFDMVFEVAYVAAVANLVDATKLAQAKAGSRRRTRSRTSSARRSPVPWLPCSAPQRRPGWTRSRSRYPRSAWR